MSAATRSKMDGATFTRIREHLGLDKIGMAEVLSDALGRRYDNSRLGEWERDARSIPRGVAEFMEAMALEKGIGGEALTVPPPPPPDDNDVPPAADEPDRPAPQPALSPNGGAYAKACEELWEMVGVGLTMVGSVTGSQAMTIDGQIIVGDKQALGRAYGKLAETNETFRRLLISMTTSGAWLEVAVVTAGTASKMIGNHQQIAAAQRQQAERSEGDEPGPRLAAV